MWVLVMFDLPVKSKQQRKRATKFRQYLKQDGFNMLQFSVYSRPSPSEENAIVHCNRVKAEMPTDGQVRILRFTDKQYARMECFFSRKPKDHERIPEQIELF
ncbi:MAG: CRISPR-associated endonuclease Cas2 [Deltaproteobacteria bacterium]|nr:CRISPR-associated endonuclease Cas2 [Deltaproteobacteria bacterium]